MGIRILLSVAGLLFIVTGCTGPVTESQPIPCEGCCVSCNGYECGSCVMNLPQLPMVEGSVVMPPSSQYVFSGIAGIPPYTYSVTSISGKLGTIDSAGKYIAPDAEALNIVTITDSIGSSATSQVNVSNSAPATSVGIYRFFSSPVEYGNGVTHFFHSYSFYDTMPGLPYSLDNKGQPLLQIFTQSIPNTSQILGCSLPPFSMTPPSSPLNFNDIELNCPGTGATVSTSLGYIYTSQISASQPLYLCYDSFNFDFLITFSQSCGELTNYTLEPVNLGFALEN